MNISDPFNNEATIVSRRLSEQGDKLIVLVHQRVRRWIDSRNSTVNFRNQLIEPTRDEIVALALQQGAMAPEDKRDYTEIFVEPLMRPDPETKLDKIVGYTASIEQLNYAYPESDIELTFDLAGRQEADFTDEIIIALGREQNLLAPAIDP